MKAATHQAAATLQAVAAAPRVRRAREVAGHVIVTAGMALHVSELAVWIGRAM